MVEPASRLAIGFFGEFNAGKSSLLNSLVGRTVQDVDVRPTTARICALVNPQAPVGRINGAQRVEVRSPWLRWGVQLWDTPGWNAEDASHAEWAEQAAREIGAAVYVLDATKAIHRSDAKQFAAIASALSARAGPPPLLVLSHFDRFVPESEDDEQDLLEDVRRHLGVGSGGVFRVHTGNLDLFDGARFREELQRIILADRRTRLLAEVRNDRRHPLRQAVARQETWRSLIDEELASVPLDDELQDWEAHCEAQQKAFAAARLSAFTGYIAENAMDDASRAAGWRDWQSKHWSGWRAGVEVRGRIVIRATDAISAVHQAINAAGMAEGLSSSMPDFDSVDAGCAGLGGVVGLLVLAGVLTGGVAVLVVLAIIALIIAMVVVAWVFVAAAAALELTLVLLFFVAAAALYVVDILLRSSWWLLVTVALATAFAALLLSCPFRVGTISKRLVRARQRFLEATGLAPPLTTSMAVHPLAAARADI